MPMIHCADCGKEMSDAAPACPHCGKPNITTADNNRSVSILLGIGILLMPIIFSWFTLRKGYTKLARIVSFTWLVVSLAIYGASDKPVQQSSSTSGTVKQEVVEAKEQVLQVGIHEILADYRNNEVAADNKYKGNLIEVTGVIDDIKKDILGDLYVTIGTGQQFEIPQVQAFFSDSMNNQLAQLNKGNRVTVVCRVDGLMMNVLARKCLIK